MKPLFTSLLLCMLFAGCRHSNKNKEIDVYFNKEIQNRISLIRAQSDSMQIDALKIDREINRLILMSKDLENIVATTGRANRYFETLAGTYRLNSADFGQLTPDMELDHMASLLKENELGFFNQMIFKMKPAGGTPIYTAH